MDNQIENYTPEGDLLDIVTYPASVLSRVSQDVTEFNAELESLCKNMLFTMYNAPGIGLAAPQINIAKRIFVLDVDYTREETEEDSGEYILEGFNPRVFINPKISNPEGRVDFQEGCLSLPGIYEDVKRFETITLEYQDTTGQGHTLDADELLSICIQHENDHLDGIVFIDRLSLLKKKFLKKKIARDA